MHSQVATNRSVHIAVLIIAYIVGLGDAFTPISPTRTALQFQRSSSRSPSRTVALHDTVSESIEGLQSDGIGLTPALPQRGVQKVEQFARLPVWPAWYGVAIFIASRVFGNDAAAKLENTIGGRVCPNFYTPEETSPFIMLVHHSHSYFKFDPLRWFQQNFILPEGFPSHPHRGFTTLTYFLKGGFQHRDSLGIQQRYGAKEDGYQHHSQWLFTGAGLLHEEMFDFQKSQNGNEKIWARQELYQLWLNVPGKDKLQPPQCLLLGDDDESYPTPHVAGDGGTETVILAGTHGGVAAGAPTMSSAAILHVQCPPGTVWKHELPAQHSTVIIYVRQGSAKIGSTELPVHHTAFLEPGRNTENSQVTIEADGKDGIDFMFLAGEPLNEPVSAQGSMVMNFPDQINNAYVDYQNGKMGTPWDHKLSDAEWQDHVLKNPCNYRYSETSSSGKSGE